VEGKKVVLIVLVFLIIVIIFCFSFFSNRTSSENKYCVMGGAKKAPGIDFISDNILLKCDCQGDVKHRSNIGCLDCDYYECMGEVKHTCYHLTQEFSYYDYLTNSTYLDESGIEIPCPPNEWQSR
jgi:hypothetical protein